MPCYSNMRIVVCIIFFLLGLHLDAQIFHRRSMTIAKKTDVCITGTWKVVKHVQWWDNVRVNESSSGNRTSYYQFGDSTDHHLEMFTFIDDSVPHFGRQLFSDWHFYDSIGDSCWLTPASISWDGYYCPYEGNGGGWFITEASDSTMQFTCCALIDSFRRADTLELIKVSSIKLPVEREGKVLNGEFILADTLLYRPWLFRSFNSKLTDSTCSQDGLSYYVRWIGDTLVQKFSASMDFHFENFCEHTLVVSGDRTVMGWLVMINEDELWLTFSNDCHAVLQDGTYKYRRIH